MHKKSKNKKGYTLIELSVVLVIVSLLTAAGLTLGAGMVNQAAHVDTKKIMDQLDQSLRDYYAVNGALPCPASQSSAITDADFGRSVTACEGTSTISGVTLSGDVRAGMVPVRTLGLSDRAASDKYGNRILYAVTRQLTDANVFGSEDGAITVRDGGDADILTDAAYFLWSAGKDHKGAPLYASASVATGCGATLNRDVENCDSDAIFRDAPYNNGDIASTFFDDHVRWVPKFHLTAKSSSSDTLWAANGDENLFSVGTDGETSNTNVGIGTNTPSAKLHVQGMTRSNQFFVGATESLDDLYYMTTGDSFLLGAANTGFPTSNEVVFMKVDHSDASPDDGMSFVNYGTSGPELAMRISGGGNVGIGKINPQVPLDVEGEARANFLQAYNPGQNSFIKSTSGQYGGIHFYDSDNNVSASIMLHNSASNGVRFRVGSGDDAFQPTRMRIMASSGYVSIGGQVAQEKLDVDGRVRADGFVSTSDERLKKDIEPLTNALEKIRQLRGVYFRWNPDAPLRDKQSDIFDDESRHIGVIAQNVQSVYPEAVRMMDHTVLTVEKDALVPALIEAVKELDGKVTVLSEAPASVQKRDNTPWLLLLACFAMGLAGAFIGGRMATQKR